METAFSMTLARYEPVATVTYRVGLTAVGTAPSREALGPALSADGRWAGLVSSGVDVVTPDLIENSEVYVRGPLPR